jgi:hypothetical protein
MTCRKRGAKYQLVAKDGHVLGTHKTKAECEEQERAIQAAKAKRRQAKRRG